MTICATHTALHPHSFPMPSTIISYLAWKTSQAIPTSPQSGSHTTLQNDDKTLPSISLFIESVISRSGTSMPTLIASLVYLWRLQQRLPADVKPMPSAPHRVFLAALILATKNLHDGSPFNTHWCCFGFSIKEVNLMERQFLHLLDWDVRIHPQDWNCQLQPWLMLSYGHRPLNAELHPKIACQPSVGQQRYPDGGSENLARLNRRHDSARGTKASTQRRV